MAGPAKKAKTSEKAPKRPAKTSAAGDEVVLKSPPRVPTSRSQEKELTLVSPSRSRSSASPLEVARVRAFPQDAEILLAEVSGFVKGGVAAFSKLREANVALEGEKQDLATKVLSLEKKLEMAEAEVKKAKASKVKAEAEATECRAKAEAREAELVASQGEVLRAFAEKIFVSGQFSALVGGLSSILNQKVVVETLDAVAKDIPDLDKVKYGYGDVSKEAIFQAYVEGLAAGKEEFPVVEHFATATTLLSAEEIRTGEVDRDVGLEEALARLQEDEAAADGAEGTGVEGTGGPVPRSEDEPPSGVS